MSQQLDQVLKNQKRAMDGDLGDTYTEENITQLVGFIVGEEEYAIPILNIQEIINL
jgi:purine-binding chemotaxis protein CheW